MHSFEKITSQELKDAGLPKDPSKFEEGLKGALLEKRKIRETVLSVPIDERLPEMKYPTECPVKNWEDLFEFDKSMDGYKKRNFLETVRATYNFLSSDFIEDKEEKKKIDYILNKQVKSGYKRRIKDSMDHIFPGISEKKLPNKDLDEKATFLVGILTEYGIDTPPHFVHKKIISEIQNIPLFIRVVNRLKENFSDAFAILYCYEIARDQGESFLETIIAGEEKIRSLNKNSIVRNAIEEKYIGDPTLLMYLSGDPYLVEVARDTREEDAVFAAKVLQKIGEAQERTCKTSADSFLYFTRLVSRNKDAVRRMEWSPDFLREKDMMYESPSALILLRIGVPDSLPLPNKDESDWKTKKKLGWKYLKETNPCIAEMEEKFGISDPSDMVHLNFHEDFCAKAQQDIAKLRFLSDHPDFQKFIAEKFAIKDFNDLVKYTGLILEKRSSDPQFSERIDASSFLYQSILGENFHGIEDDHLLYQSTGDPAFVRWLPTLYKETGRNPIDALKESSIGYIEAETNAWKNWYAHQDDFHTAVSLGLFVDGDPKEYLYRYQEFSKIIHQPELRAFIESNSDMNLFELCLKDRETLESISGKWLENQKVFYRAKTLGIFANSDRLNFYESIKEIFSDDSLLQFILRNNFLDISMESTECLQSIKNWHRDEKAYFIASKIGLFQKYLPVRDYDQFSCVKKFSETDVEKIRKLLAVEMQTPILRNLEKLAIASENGRSVDLEVFRVFLEDGWIHDEEIYNLPINRENFLDFMGKGEALITIEKDLDCGLHPFPWTKEWFLEDKNRLSFLKKDSIDIFKKFGTVIAIALLESSGNAISLKKYYEDVISQTNRENERRTMLQLGEIFSVAIRNGNYDFFDRFVELSPKAGDIFRNFVEKGKIGEKGMTILTLLFSSSINMAYQTGTDRSIESAVRTVYDRIRRYSSILDTYESSHIPSGLGVSVGMEYEVTESIARGYHERTNSSYKNDIETLSCYSGISKGRDAVHEIATQPTDNPYFLLLEMKLLEELDFIDLNFKYPDYEKGSRSYHISFGGEHGITHDAFANFSQNIVLASDLGGVNSGKYIDRVNKYSNIRDRGDDCLPVFGKRTPCVEYRALSIDKAEPFEKGVVSLFNLNIAKQALNKYTNISPDSIRNIDEKHLVNKEAFQVYCESENIFKEDKKIEDSIVLGMIFSFVKIQKRILTAIQEHRDKFFEKESVDFGVPETAQRLLNGWIEGGKQGKILLQRYFDVNFRYLTSLSRQGALSSQDVFYQKLSTDGKTKELEFPEKHRRLCYLWYKKFIEEPIVEMRRMPYSDSIQSLIDSLETSGIEDLYRRMQNNQRFQSVMNSESLDKNRLQESIAVSSEDIYAVVNAGFLNKLTMIHNLFLKPPTIDGISVDSANVSAMFNTAHLQGSPLNNDHVTEGFVDADPDAPQRTIFDCIDQKKISRQYGTYIIQGASSEMIIEKFQDSLVEFNKEILALLR